MKTTRWLALTSVLMAFSSLSTSANAQDDAFQTGQTARAYNYFQAVYLFDQEGIDLPVLFNLQVSIHPNFVLSAEYLNLSSTSSVIASDGNPYNVKVSIISSEFGIGYHRASERWPRIDWLADILYTTTELAAGFSGAAPVDARPAISETVNSTALQLGLRGTVTPKIEAQALAVTFYRDGEFANELLDLTAVYRASKHIDIAIGARNAAESPNYNLGLRYNW